MLVISRREFFKSAATDAAVAGFISAGALELRANPLGMPIGCQTYPVRTMVAQDFPGTIKQLAEAGSQAIELCSPVGYADSGFSGIAKYKGAELRRILGDLGVKCESSHFDMKELRENLAGRIAWAKDVGLTQMMVEGELLQLERIGRIDVTEADCMELVDRKTACLFSVCAKLGALVAGADSQTVAELSRNRALVRETVLIDGKNLNALTRSDVHIPGGLGRCSRRNHAGRRGVDRPSRWT